MPVNTPRTHLVSMRLPHEMIERIDALAPVLARRFGINASRTDVARALIAAGLAAYEAENPQPRKQEA